MIEELVVRDLVRAHIVPDLVERPVGERVELHDVPVLPIELDLRDVAPAHPLLAAEPGDPRVERRELALQGFDLADVAARDPEVDRAVHQVRPVRRRELRHVPAVRHLELDMDAVALVDLLEQRVRLRRQAPGVEREDPDIRVDAPRHVHQRQPVDAPRGADRDPRVERVERPCEELLGARTLEAIGGIADPRGLLIEEGNRGFVDGLDGIGVCHGSSFEGLDVGAGQEKGPPARRPLRFVASEELPHGVAGAQRRRGGTTAQAARDHGPHLTDRSCADHRETSLPGSCRCNRLAMAPKVVKGAS